MSAKRASAASAFDARVNELLASMTLEEKIAQLGSVDTRSLLDGRKISLEKCRQFMANGIGQISRVGGDTDLSPQEIADATSAIQTFLSTQTRLAVPAIVHEECLSGYMVKYATTFPEAIGLASTWNPPLVEEVAASIRGLMRSVGAHQGLSPLFDVARDPRYGRIEETFGEDPYLVGAIGCAYVRGLQGDDLSKGVIATGKHLAGYAMPDGGRNIASVRLGPREMRDVYLQPFEAAVKTAGLGSVMNGYQEIDGVPCVADRQLFTEILRKEWGFDGIVVSDYGSIEMLRTWHQAAATRKEAARMALEAGIDVELNVVECYGDSLAEAVKDGSVSAETLDESVRRVLRAKMRLGLFEKSGPFDEHPSVEMFDSADNRALARRAAEESIALLKNENGLLPLSKDVSRIAVIGPNADSREAMLGDYSYVASMSYWRKADPDWSALKVTTVLEGLSKVAGANAEIVYARGCDVAGESRDLFDQAVAAAASADVIVAVMGENSFHYTGEHRDRDSLGLLGVQEELVRELASTGVPIVLVLLNGRPLALGGVDKYCAAVLEAWYPGEEGGTAVANVLFGKVNPSGKLPASFPENVGQIPVHYSRKPLPYRGYVPSFDKGDARYPFGHGLSYTTFAYGGLEISPGEIDAGAVVRIACSVENTGSVEGAEVVQLYVRDVAASLVRPVKELKGFARLTLVPGESRRVEFALDTDILAFTNAQMKLVVEGGRFEVFVGSSSTDIRLRGAFDVKGGKTLDGRRKFFSAVTVRA